MKVFNLRRGLGAAFAAMALAPLTPAAAVGTIDTVILPDAVSYEYFGLNYEVNVRRSYTVGTLDYTGGPGCAGTCYATTTLGADPSVYATVSEEVFGGASGGYVEAVLGYYVEYLNAPGDYGISLTATDTLSSPDGSAMSAGLKFGKAGSDPSSFNNFATEVFEEADCLVRCPAPGFIVPAAPFVPTHIVQMTANTPYFLRLSLLLDAQPTMTQINALIDPTFSDNGAGGRFVFSSGVFQAPTGVPEPAGWVMMIGGFGFVGGALRRRRSDPAKAILILGS